MMNNSVEKIVDDENGCVKVGNHKIWKFVHQEDFDHKSNLLEGRSCNFNWLSISEDGTIQVKGSRDNGYAWDGCTPKFNFLQITWGICDGGITKFGKGDYKPYTYYASMIHDVLYQYKRCAPVTRKEADKIFYKMLKKSGFKLAPIYYLFVRSFGWWFKGWKYKSTSKIKIDVK